MASSLKFRVGAPTLAGCFAVLHAGAGLAQTATTDSSTTAKTDEIQEIVVTGSRIRRYVPDTSQPIDVISGQDIRDRGIANVADIINELPVAGVPTSAVGAQGANNIGKNFINLFNLGPQRTLVLVNGRRFVSGNPPGPTVLSDSGSQANVSGGGSQVDINNIPVGLIERIETVEAGGAAVYGSDAIAGVVNIITKTSFEGVEADAQYGRSDLSDYPTRSARLTAGQNFFEDRANVAVNLEFSKTDGLTQTDREFSAAGITSVANPRRGESGQPQRIYVPDHRFVEFTASGVPFRAPAPLPNFIIQMPNPSNPSQMVPAQFAPDGTLVPFNLGTYYQPAFASGGDGYQLAAVTSLVTSVERKVGTAFGHYDLTDNIKLSTELLYSEVEATEPASQGIFNTSLLAPPNNAIRLTVANPFLSDQARGVLTSQGIGAFFLGRAFLDLVPNNSARDSLSKTKRGLLALDGDFDMDWRNFYWNTSVGYGELDGTISTWNINQARFVNAINAVRAPSGEIVCAATLANPSSADPDVAQCRPLNPFGAGAPSAAAREYLALLFENSVETDQTDVTANFGGDLFKLPGGALSFTTGIEYRRETADFRPNEAAALGLGREIPIVAQSGKYDTKEFYGEILVPVFGEDFTFPGLQRLEVNASARHVDHSIAGTNDAWSAGVQWSPINSLTVRATRSKTFRSPSLTELFLPASSSTAAGRDPCDAREIAAGPNPATRTANCQALFTQLGLPATFQLTSLAQNAGVSAINSGDPTLQNEDADSWSVGLSYEPEFIAGLRVSFDHVEIDITNGITTFDMQTILSTCYDDPNYPASPVCSRFTRDNQAQLTSMRTGFVNAAFSNFRGDAFNVDYDVPLPQWFGGLRVSLEAFHLRRLETSVSGLGYDLNQAAGEIETPEWTGRGSLSYTRGPFGAIWTTRYVSSSEFDLTNTAATADILGVSSYWKHDLVLRYELFDRVTTRAGVTNLTNEFPPYPISYANNGIYDVIGRAYFAGVTARF